MKSTPLIINWHESNLPIYSADFQKVDKGRLATGGGDNNVRVRDPFTKECLRHN
jgi:chromatin assembly factor 1 subunit B